MGISLVLMGSRSNREQWCVWIGFFVGVASIMMGFGFFGGDEWCTEGRSNKWPWCAPAMLVDWRNNKTVGRFRVSAKPVARGGPSCGGGGSFGCFASAPGGGMHPRNAAREWRNYRRAINTSQSRVWIHGEPMTNQQVFFHLIPSCIWGEVPVNTFAD